MASENARHPGKNEGHEPRTFGNYTIVSELGRGGMGVVYEAIDRDMDRRVALKVLPAGLKINEKSVVRFRREARIIGQLSHPSIVAVFSTGVEGDTPYLSMELVEGESLASMLARKQAGADEDTHGLTSRMFTGIAKAFAQDETTQAVPITADNSATEAEGADVGSWPRIPTSTEEMDLTYCIRMARAFAAVAEGLQHAHSKGIIHRDLKPSNLILDPQGDLRILDFGLARLEGQESLTGTGEVLGTPRYMSPEQVGSHSASVDQRTDVYSLGATLYEALTLRPPLQGRTAQETLHRILYSEPRPLQQLNPRVPLDLETIVQKCLRKDPVERYGTAEAFAQDLHRFARGDAIEARPPSLAERIARRLLQHRGKVAAAAALFLLLLAVTWLAYSRAAESHRRKVAEYDRDVVNAVVKLQASGAFQEYAQDLTSDSLDFNAELLMDGLGWREDALIVEATEMLERSCAAVPDRPEAYYHLARALLLLGEEDRAIQELSRAVERDFVPAMVLKASLHRRRGELDASKTLLDLARQSGQDTWARSWLAAQVALAERRWADAASEYDRLIDLAKAEPSPYLGSQVEVYLGCGIARLRLKEYDAARQNFVVASALCPGAVEPELLLGYACLAEGNDREADEAFERLYARHPAGDVVERITSFYVLNFMRFEKGLYWAERTPPGYFREVWRALCFRFLGRSDEARSAANELIKMKPDVAFSYFIPAAVSLDRKEWADAERFARKGAELAPKSGVPYVLLGTSLRAQGKQKQSLEMAQMAVQIEPDSPMAHFQLGIDYLNTEQLEQAAQSIQKAVELGEHVTGGIFGSGAPHLLLGDLYEKLGKSQESLTTFKQAVILAKDFVWNPGWPELLPILARAQFVTGHLVEAINTAEKALSADSAPTETIPQLEKQLAEYAQALLPDLPSYRSIELALGSLPQAEQRASHADDLLAAFREVANGSDAVARVAYLEARVLQLKQEHEAAVTRLSVPLAHDPLPPEPLLALVHSLRRLGKPEQAEQQLRNRLSKDCPNHIQLWNSWLAVGWNDLGRTTEEIRSQLPCQSHRSDSQVPFADAIDLQASLRYLDDINWLLDCLENEEPIRINCGGDRYEGPKGVVWGRDRFYTRGSRYMQGRQTFQDEIANTENDPLYQTARYFPPSTLTPAGYKIPLPPGKYHVDLHFAEIGLREGAGQRAFDVVLEGERVLAHFDPGAADFAVAQSKSFTVSVTDGLLDIVFEFQVENPLVSAIEVQQTDAITRGVRG